jgi:hypothetical protein
LELFWAKTPVQQAQEAIKIIAKNDLESDLENACDVVWKGVINGQHGAGELKLHYRSLARAFSSTG